MILPKTLIAEGVPDPEVPTVSPRISTSSANNLIISSSYLPLSPLWPVVVVNSLKRFFRSEYYNEMQCNRTKYVTFHLKHDIHFSNQISKCYFTSANK